MKHVTFGSVCSGIEAASVAWEPLGWKAEWFCEIEPFPSAVLAHHYPDVANMGDMTRVAALIEDDMLPAPDVLVGGTPCQSFSLAGRRGSLDDARGALSLVFVQLADQIDRKREENGEEPCTVLWENVPGALSTKDNAFGCLLAALAGEDEELVAPRGRWSNAGYVLGPQRTVAWRVLDAQYFGLAQRRKRLFVVASARKQFDPRAVLFEFGGLRRDSAPSRTAREGASRTPRIGFALSSFAQYRDGLATLRAMGGDYGDGSEMLVREQVIPILEAGARTGVSTDDLRAGIGIGENGDPMYTLQAGKQHAVAFPLDLRNAGRDPEKHDAMNRQGVGAGEAGDPSHTLSTAFVPGVAVAFGGDLARTLAARYDSSPCADRGRDVVATSQACVRRLTPRECERLQGFPDDYTLIPFRGKPAADGNRYKALGNSMAVPVMRWIGTRIDSQLRLLAENDFDELLDRVARQVAWQLDCEELI